MPATLNQTLIVTGELRRLPAGANAFGEVAVDLVSDGAIVGTKAHFLDDGFDQRVSFAVEVPAGNDHTAMAVVLRTGPGTQMAALDQVTIAVAVR